MKGLGTKKMYNTSYYKILYIMKYILQNISDSFTVTVFKGKANKLKITPRVGLKRTLSMNCMYSCTNHDLS